ncbi:uncharacterized protein LOC115237099 [Formica exsecta]|uniref:uncharacterized protein LOC115237099 n=1 Tax=Formica exsecta TaxID=72781 RepID=UPI001144FAF4|nr:uncharacterized protein LOC115237099 [Formica exsecta]
MDVMHSWSYVTREMRMRRKRLSPDYHLQAICAYQAQVKINALIEEHSTEDEKNELREDDPRCDDIWSEPKMTEEEVESCKREKDWTERRKYDEVDDKIRKLENRNFFQNKDMCNRYDSFVTCWNDCSALRITGKAYKDLTGRETCCPEYPLHKIFLRKDSLNRTLNSLNPLVMNTNTPDNRCTNEDHISSKPTLVRQNAQWWSRGQRITPRRSILKAHAAQALVNTTILSAAHSLANTPSNNSRQDSTRIVIKNLESDGDSPRSASPQSSEADEDESIFRNGQIKVHEKLSEYISEGAASASRDTSGSGSESPDQQVRRPYIQRKEKESRETERKEREVSVESDTIKNNTLNDHCYHQSRSMERLRRQTFSETDEEEEIDVVSYEKKATYLNFAQKQHDANQLALNFPEKQHNANQLALNFAEKQHNANKLATNIDKTTVRRPRGRPPGPNSAKRKRNAQISSNEASGPPPKQARVQTYQRGQKRQKCARQWRTQTFEDDDEEDKRNLHNNMERQRRISMKNFFDVLKQHVPAIANKERVAKVTILRQAKAYINTLEAEDIVSLPERKKLERQQQILRKKLEELQRAQNRMLRLQRRY